MIIRIAIEYIDLLFIVSFIVSYIVSSIYSPSIEELGYLDLRLVEILY